MVKNTRSIWTDEHEQRAEEKELSGQCRVSEPVANSYVCKPYAPASRDVFDVLVRGSPSFISNSIDMLAWCAEIFGPLPTSDTFINLLSDLATPADVMRVLCDIHVPGEHRLLRLVHHTINRLVHHTITMQKLCTKLRENTVIKQRSVVAMTDLAVDQEAMMETRVRRNEH